MEVADAMVVGAVVDGGSSGREDSENVEASCGANAVKSIDGDEPLAELPTVSEIGVALVVFLAVVVLVLAFALAWVLTPVGSRGAGRAGGGGGGGGGDASDDDNRRGLS